jgi:hypothetical protein
MANISTDYTTPADWVPWRVDWSAIWVGALAALSASLVFGLLATALGAQTSKAIASWKAVGTIDVAIVILTAFFAFAIGGWAAGKITGALHSERTILHAAIAWAVSTPLLVALLAAGAGNAFGGWYGGFMTSPLGAAASALPPSPDAIRNSAMAALTALLVGLIGAVLGGWMASGEPMSFTHSRKHDAALPARKGQV